MKRRNFIKGLFGIAAIPVMAKASINQQREIKVEIGREHPFPQEFVENLQREINKKLCINGVEIAEIHDWSIS